MNLTGIPRADSQEEVEGGSAPQIDLSGIPKAAPNLEDNYAAASRIDPDQAAQVEAISRNTGANPDSVYSDLSNAKPALQSPGRGFFASVSNNYPKTAQFLGSVPNMAKTQDDLHNLVAHENSTQAFEGVQNYYQALKAAFQGSVFGTIYDRGAPTTTYGPQTTFGQKLVGTGAEMALDFPFMAIGGVAGAAAGPFGVGAGAFALPAVLKSAITEYNRTGDSSGLSNALEKSFNVAKAGGKAAVVGLITDLTGGLVNKATIGAALPTAEQMAGMTFKQTMAKFLAQNAAMTMASAGVEGKLPTAEDLGTNAILLAGLHGASTVAGSIFDVPMARGASAYAQDMHSFAMASKFRARDPEGYAAHMDQISPTPVQIPVEAFDSKIGPRLTEQLGLEDAYNEAKATGGNVSVPMGKFLSPYLDAQRPYLFDDVKFDPESKTLNQIAAMKQEGLAELQKGHEAALAAKSQGLIQRISQQISDFFGLSRKATEPEESLPTAGLPAEGEGSEGPLEARSRASEGSATSSFPQPFDESITSNPYFVKALEEARPVMQEYGVPENDPGAIVDLFRNIHTRMGDLVDESKEPGITPERTQQISDELQRLGAQLTPMANFSQILANPADVLPYIEAREKGIKATPPSEESLNNFLENYDRQKAVKSEVAQAQIDSGLAARPDLSKLDPEYQEKLGKLDQAANDEAERILSKPYLEAAKAENRAALNAKIKDLTEKAKADVDQLPIFQAGRDLQDAFGKSLQPAEIANRFLEGRGTPIENMRFEEIAQLNGYSSGDELANRVINSWRLDEHDGLVKALVDKDLQEAGIKKSLPEMRLDALKAVHSEKAGELLALRKEIFEGAAQGLQQDAEFKKGISDRAKQAWEDAKVFARDTIRSKDVNGATSFRQYYTAERDAALKTHKAAKAGDMERAAEGLREQLNAHALAGESLRARDNVKKWLRSIANQRKAPMKSFKTEDNFAQAASIMDRFGFERQDFDPAKRYQTLAEWAQEKKDNGMDHAIAQWIFDENIRQPFRTLKLFQLQDVRNAITNIKHIGNMEKQMELIHKNEGLDALVDELHAAKEANTIGGKTRRAGDPARNFESLRRNGESLLNSVVSIPSRFAEMDGFEPGIWTDVFDKSREIQKNAEIGDLQDLTEKWRDLHSVYSKKELADMAEKPIFVPELKRSLTKNQLLTIRAYQGVEDAKAKVAADLGVDQENIDGILDRELTKRDHDFVQKKVDLIGSYWPRISELYRRKSGFAPDPVDPIPVATRFGEYPGGYYPLIADPLYTTRRLADISDDMTLMDPYPTWKAATRNGFTEARKYYARYPVSLDSDAALRHLQDVVHDLNFNEWVSDSTKLLSHPSVAQDLIDALGRQAQQGVNNWVKEIAGNNVVAKRGFFDNMARKLRENTTIAMLGTNISVALSQFHGITLAAKIEPDFGWGDVLSGMTDGFLKLAFHPGEYMDMVNRVHELSPFMRQQSERLDSSLAATNADLFGREGTIAKGTETVAHGFFNGVHFMSAIPLWDKAYQKGLQKFSFDSDAAANYANRILRGATVTSDPADLPSMMKDNELGKLVTQFFGFFNKQMQAMYQAQGRFRNALTRGEAMAAVPRLAGDIAAISIFPSVLYSLTHYGLPTDDYSRKKWLASTIRGMSPVTWIPGANAVQDMLINSAVGLPMHANVAPAAELFDAIQESIGRAQSRHTTGEVKAESAARVAALALPYPQKLNDLFFNAYDIANGMPMRFSDFVKRRPRRERY